ncbi:MAG: 5'-nucleotidase C-terminal domain-containing protein [Elusimicrobium sp.]|jgi:2',3'-cyclic-nucleotide 2'-phosphodiesterase/3'-nucleotidase|nr:5'-nucleotidase C-terminal domain-containing protein [Elusimicrobium sp.]
MKKLLILLLLLPLVSCKEKPFAVINIYHTGGVGGMYWSREEPAFDNRAAGGYAVLKNFLASQPGKKLILDSGDWFSQTPEGTLFKATFPLGVMKELGYDATGISDQDINPGWAPLYDSIKNSGMTVISSNLQTKTGAAPPRVQSFVIKEISGVKVGIFSLIITANILAAQSRLGDVSAQDEIDAAAAAVNALKDKGADIIILLTDIGENDVNFDEHSILEQVEGIDLILSVAAQGDEADMEKYNGAFIVRSAPFLTSVSKLKITFDGDKKISMVRFDSAPLLKDTYGEDEDLAAQITRMRASAHKKLNYVVATAENEIKDVDNAPGYLGELIAGCLKEWAKTDIGIINSDSVRSNIPAGKITEYSLYELYPYGDTVMSVRLRGEEIKNIIEKSLSSKNNFPQFAGVKIEYDPSAGEGARIKKILVNNAPVQPQTIYRMAATDHIIAGGFGHDEFINVVEFKNTQIDVRAVLRQCFAKKKIIKDEPPAAWKTVQ